MERGGGGGGGGGGRRRGMGEGAGTGADGRGSGGVLSAGNMSSQSARSDMLPQHQYGIQFGPLWAQGTHQQWPERQSQIPANASLFPSHFASPAESTMQSASQLHPTNWPQQQGHFGGNVASNYSSNPPSLLPDTVVPQFDISSMNPLGRSQHDQSMLNSNEGQKVPQYPPSQPPDVSRLSSTGHHLHHSHHLYQDPRHTLAQSPHTSHEPFASTSAGGQQWPPHTRLSNGHVVQSENEPVAVLTLPTSSGMSHQGNTRATSSSSRDSVAGLSMADADPMSWLQPMNHERGSHTHHSISSQASTGLANLSQMIQRGQRLEGSPSSHNVHHHLHDGVHANFDSRTPRSGLSAEAFNAYVRGEDNQRAPVSSPGSARLSALHTFNSAPGPSIAKGGSSDISAGDMPSAAQFDSQSMDTLSDFFHTLPRHGGSVTSFGHPLQAQSSSIPRSEAITGSPHQYMPQAARLERQVSDGSSAVDQTASNTSHTSLPGYMITSHTNHAQHGHNESPDSSLSHLQSGMQRIVDNHQPRPSSGQSLASGSESSTLSQAAGSLASALGPSNMHSTNGSVVRQRANTMSFEHDHLKDGSSLAFHRSNSSDGPMSHNLGSEFVPNLYVSSAFDSFVQNHQPRDQHRFQEPGNNFISSTSTAGSSSNQHQLAFHQQGTAEGLPHSRRESDSARLSAALANAQIASSSRDAHSTTPTIMEEDETMGPSSASSFSRKAQHSQRQQHSSPMSKLGQRLPSDSSGFPARRSASAETLSLLTSSLKPSASDAFTANEANAQKAQVVVAHPPYAHQQIQMQGQSQKPPTPPSAVATRRYKPAVRPTTYQQLTILNPNQADQGGRNNNGSSEVEWLDEMIRHYITCPSRLGLGERTVLIMTSKVGQKSYGAEKRFLCPPPMVLLIGSSWWNACPTIEGGTLPHRFGSSDTATTLIPPRVNIGMSGEAATQDGALEWATSSGRLIDVGNPSSEMAVSGRCIGKNLYITDVDEKRRSCETLVTVSVPGMSANSPVLLGTFASKPVKIISKPSKKRQSNRNTDLGILHGSIVSLFHRLRSQTVSTRYLCVSGAPTWFKGSDGQPFLTLDQPAGQPSRVDPPSCFVAKMTSWDPFIVYLVDPTKKATDPEAPAQKPPFPGYPPPPPSAIVPSPGSPPLTVHYNQRIVFQCLNTAVVSPIMVIRKVDKATTVVGGATIPGSGSEIDEGLGDPVSQLHKIALEVVEDPTVAPPQANYTESGGPTGSPGDSGPFLACLNESVGMRRPLEQRKWIRQPSGSFQSPATPNKAMGAPGAEFSSGGPRASQYTNASATQQSPSSYGAAAAFAAAQTQSSLAQSRHPPGSSGSSSGAGGLTNGKGALAGSPYAVPGQYHQQQQPPESSDGGKVKRPRRVSSSVVPQGKDVGAFNASGKGRRRGQSLSVVEWQKEQARQWQVQQNYSQSGGMDAEASGNPGGLSTSGSNPDTSMGGSGLGAAWTVEIADSDVWTIVGTDIARHTFYIPPTLAGGISPATQVPNSGIAHLITTPAPSAPITPVPVLHYFVPPTVEPGGQVYVTLYGENFTEDLFVYFGDWRSTHVQLQSSDTLLCAPPPPASEAFECPEIRVPVILVRKDGVIFPSDCIYSA